MGKLAGLSFCAWVDAADAREPVPSAMPRADSMRASGTTR
jgi:hypothetical protein